MSYLLENYHTHTPRCHHANGSEREYIEAAIASGMKVLGFSDHIPLPEGAVKDYWVNNIRMEMSQAQEYVSTLKQLREEYKDQIQILIGYEGEYFPTITDKQIELLKEIGYDYLILGQHYLLDYGVESYCGIPTFNSKKLKSYVDHCIEGLKTGNYMYLAHPDLLNYIGPKKNYIREYTRLCVFCKQQHIPLEINIHGCLLNRYYPNEEFFKIVKEVGNEVVLGIDGHDTLEIGNEEGYKRAIELAQKLGIDNFVSLKEKFDL